MPRVWISEEKLTELLTGDDGEMLEPEKVLGKEPEPKWFTYSNWDAATIDFGTFAEGVSVELHDPKEKFAKQVRDQIKVKRSKTKDGESAEVTFTEDHFPAQCLAYIKTVNDPEHALFPEAPDDKAGIKPWRVNFCGDLKSAVAERLRRGINLFEERDSGDLGNE